MTSPTKATKETARAFAMYDEAAAIRAFLHGGGIRFDEMNFESGSRYFFVWHPTRKKNRRGRIRVSDHPGRPWQTNIANVYPGGQTLEQAKAAVIAWLRDGAR